MKKELYGSEPHTTNNRMEIMAAIEGLQAIKEAVQVEIVTDSNYLKDGITKWIHNWKRKGWMTAGQKAGGESGSLAGIGRAEQQHKTEWAWTKGHASHADNNRCDELATMPRARKRQT